MSGTSSPQPIETPFHPRSWGGPAIGISVRLAIASVILASVMVLVITAYRVSVIGDEAVDDLHRFVSRSVSAVSLPAGHVLWDLDTRGAELIVDGLLAQEAASHVRLTDAVGVIQISKGDDRFADIDTADLDISTLSRGQLLDLPFPHSILIPDAPVVLSTDIRHPTRPDQILGAITVIGSREFLMARVDREFNAVIVTSLLLGVCFTVATIVLGYLLAARPLARLARAPALARQANDVSLSMVTLPEDLLARRDEVGTLSRAVLQSLRSVASGAQVLAEQQALLSLAQDVGRIGHVYADLGTRRTVVSDTAMEILGLSQGCVQDGECRDIGVLVRSLGDSADIMVWAEQAETAFKAARSFEGRAWIGDPEENRRYVQYRIESRSDDHGLRRGVMMIVQDVTDLYQTRHELEERTERLSEAHEIALLGTLRIDVASETVHLSPELSRLLGIRARDGSLSMPLEEYDTYFDPEEMARLRQDAVSAFDRGEVATGRLRFRPGVPGEERWLAYRMLHRRDETGRIYERYGINRDITKQVRLEAEREQARTLLANVIEHASIDIAVRDLGGELLLANAGMRRKFALWEAGRLGADLFSPTAIRHDLDALPAATGPTEAVTGVQKSLVVLNDADGRTGDYEVVTFPIRDDEGRLTAVGTLVSDVSELKDAQRALQKANEGLEDLVDERTRALRESEERYRVVAEASSDWFFELDRDLRIQACSPGFERVTGLPAAQVIGTRYQSTEPDIDVIGPEEYALWRQAVDLLSTLQPVRELRYWMKVGTEHRYMRTSGSPILRDGAVVGLRCGSTDLTEFRQVQDQLQETEKMASLGRLVAGVSHELNTPLGSARTVISSLETRVAAFEVDTANGSRDGLEAPFVAKLKRGLRIASEGLDRSVALLQTFKQVAADRTNDTLRPFVLKEVIEANVEAMEPTMVGCAVTVKILVPDNIELVGYPGPLGQVITNLIQNAYRHGFADRDTGLIMISAWSLGSDTVEITVADDGVGIPDEVLPRVFEPFFTTKIGAGGTGLGLSIAFNIVTGMMGGRINVRSSAAKGTMFVIRVPRVAPEGRAPHFGPSRS